MSPESAQAEKSAIRQRILSLRGKLPASARTAASERIARRLLQLPQYQSATSLMAYMNYGSEVASELVVRTALADGKRVALPRVNRITDHLDLYWVEDPEQQLLPGSWGIREPVAAQCERLNSPNEVEFALLPGVAFCRDGSRLGYGGGYFDKLLVTPGGEIKNGRPTLVAAAFALQIVEALPQLPTDVKVGWIVTEQETIDCGN